MFKNAIKSKNFIEKRSSLTIIAEAEQKEESHTMAKPGTTAITPQNPNQSYS